ncbi:MAG: MBL fold metallo-hydrolase [Candidatus Bathyarchaeia archaeon]
MVRIRFLGGVEGLIGGNQILLEEGGTRIFLDLGMNYSQWLDFFEFIFSEPRGLTDLRQVGMLPKDEELKVDACFVSHAHGDHWRLISALPEKTPVYLGECPYKLLRAWLGKGRGKRGFKEYGHLEFRTFHSGEKILIGNLKVEPFSVDHSIPGAYGFLVETSSGNLLYTGDFRLHGRYRPPVSLFDEASQRGSTSMICEGTNVGQLVSPNTELDVERQLEGIVSRCENLAILDLAASDVDRIKTVQMVAKTSGRCLAATKPIITVLKALEGDEKLRPPRIGVDILPYEDAEAKIQAKPSGFILCTSFYSEREVRELKPPPGSLYLLSSSEPFEEERLIAFQRLQNWLRLFGAPMYHLHSSGHVYPMDLRRIVREIKPKELFPIHTGYPEAMRAFLQDLTKVRLPMRGQIYEALKE